jgi:hypothetical protein
MNKHILHRLYCVIGLGLIACAAVGTLYADGSSPVPGSPILPRDTNRTINLSTFRGSTYLQAMQSSGSGIFDKTDADDNSAVTIASPNQIIGDINQFDPRVCPRRRAAEHEQLSDGERKDVARSNQRRGCNL